jgi:O-methyltransferase domain
VSQPTAEVPLPTRLTRMIMSAWVPQVIYTATALGLPDQLGMDRKRSDELAKAVDAPVRNVHRILRALVMLELCTEPEPGLFALTPMGAYLRSDAADSMRNWALLWGRPGIWTGWGRLLDCVKTGEIAPKLISGKATPFEWMEDDPEGLEIFNKSMAELTGRAARAVGQGYDFAGIRRIVDVGGGFGALLREILTRHPEMTGVVFDLPYCREGAERLLAEAGLAERCEFVAGDFFESVPSGADAFIIKSVIHDWDDERSVAILRNCRKAMTAAARLLLVEGIAPETVGTSPFDAIRTGSDLNMMLMTGGCERTEGEYRALLEAAGLRVARVVPTPSPMSVVEARSGAQRTYSADH